MQNDPTILEDRELRRVLLEADVTPPELSLKVDAATLLAAVRRRRVRNRQFRGGAVAASIVLAALLLRGSTTKEPVAPARASSGASRPALASATGSSVGSSSGPVELREKLARLEREAALHERVVRGLRRAERLAAQQAELAAATAQAPPPALAAQEASRSAAISLQYAAIVEHELRDLNQARLEYQRVSRRFPGTSWAAMAAGSLERLPFTANNRSTL